MDFPKTFFEDEVRDGFYVPAMIKRAWAAQLQMLEILRKFCAEFNITWYAAYGTLIGMARHKGFVPWDDDVDIWMKRDQYEKFLQNVNMLPDKLTFMEGRFGMEDNTLFNQMFGRIINTESMNVDQQFLEHFGGFPYSAGVDIFVLDNTAPTEQEEKARREIALFVYSTICGLKSDDEKIQKTVDNNIEFIEKISNTSINRDGNVFKQLMQILEAYCCLYDDEATGAVTSMHDWITRHAYKFDDSWFESTVELPFENTTLPAPVGYKEVLTAIYGNYMEKRQENTHDYPFYKKNERILAQHGIFLPYNFYFDNRYLEKLPKTERKKYIIAFLKIFEQSFDDINDLYIQRKFDRASEVLGNAQEVTSKLEQILGRNYPDDSGRSVQYLSEYYQKLYTLYQNVLRKDTDTCIKNEISEISRLYQMIIEEIANSIINPREIVFLVFKSCGWDNLQPLYDYFKKIPNGHVYVVPIPWYRKNLFFDPDPEPIFEGEEISQKVPVVSFDTMQLAVHTPDLIVTQNPYDEYSTGITVDPRFYSEELMKRSGKVVYVPWFQVDDVIPKHGAAWAASEYYINMPGVIRADLTLVPTYNMRRLYIEKLTAFAGVDTWKRWDASIQVASCEDDYRRIFDGLSELNSK